MILVRGLRLETREDASALKKRAAAALKVAPEEIAALEITKKSLDARKKEDIHWVCSAAVSLKRGEGKVLARGRDGRVAAYHRPEYAIPKVSAPAKRPVIAGFGPAGMFAALVLARAGACPLVLERGADADTRVEAVERFRSGGPLTKDANVQFGEGGAGTFSDGKLNTGISDSRLSWVLEQFHTHGAPESIIYDAKPHIGTDILVNVVKNIREEILSLGGEVRFRTELTGLCMEDGRLTGVLAADENGQRRIDCDRLILAVGHSARDTFELLNSLGLPMEQKPFSMGVRIEHLQRDIDRSQYGREREELPAADYSLNVHLPDGESAYTFCMCPGGEVIAAASEEGGVVTNGMSLSARAGENANAALLVTLHPEDFPDRGVLSGMYWQRDIEQAAFRYGGGSYRAPAQLAGDFLTGRASVGPGRVTPTYRPGVRWGDLHEVLPEKLTSVLEEALPELGRRLKGFDDADAVLTAPETRSSSPVRILRGEKLESVGLEGLYPCGEGAGYAGGISSAAVDGMRCAEQVLRALSE